MKYEIHAVKLESGKWIGMYNFDGHTCAISDKTQEPVQSFDGNWLVPTPLFESEEEAKEGVAKFIKEKTGEDHV